MTVPKPPGAPGAPLLAHGLVSNGNGRPRGMSAGAVEAVDPVTVEIVRNTLVAITDEMKTNLMRTGYSRGIYESQDFTVGLFDATGDTASIGLGLPMFILGLSDAVKAKLAFYGAENIHPGHVLLTNDSYLMGSHLWHIVVTLPL